MNGKKIIIIIGILVGIGIIVTSIVLYRKLGNKEDETEDFEPTYRGSSSPKIIEPKYEQQEIMRMHSWLVAKALSMKNKTIIEAIEKSGGIDGKIGKGFNTALNEAVKIGIVSSIEDLYNKSVNN
ncbi:MAG: hypothetical protein ACK476_05405 [Fluviicola sp.]